MNDEAANETRDDTLLGAGGATSEEAPSPPSSPKEVECKTCGEMVPVKSLRCWNCRSYMREDIGQKAQQMSQAPPQVIYSDVPADSEAAQDDDTYSLDTGEDALQTEDDDFELSPEIAFDEMDEDDGSAELPPSNGQSTAAPSPEASVEATIEEAGETTEDAAAETGESQAPPEPEQSHSVATGGDVLLDVALKEEQESAVRRMERAKVRAEKRKIARPGFTFVFCPHGHRMEVPEKNRGRWGRCPKCREPFHVPETPWREAAAQDEESAEAAEAKTSKPEESEVTAGAYTRWMPEVRWHVVNPEKLKLKAGSLVDDFDQRDLGFSPEMMLVLLLLKKGGFFGSVDPKKKDEAREAMLEHLRADKGLDKLPVAEQESFDLEKIEKIRVVSPVPEGDEPMFMGVPVFGEGRIWVRVPGEKGASEMKLASLHLSEFRRFVRILEDLYGVGDLTEGLDVPMTDEFTELKCHYSDEKLYVLEDVTYHQVDPAIKLQLVGRKCQECGLVVSEDSRKKEKIGGASGKGIAKAKCPKCEKKFGDISLFSIEGYQPDEEEESGAEG